MNLKIAFHVQWNIYKGKAWIGGGIRLIEQSEFKSFSAKIGKWDLYTEAFVL